TALYLSKRKNNIAIQQYNNFLKRQIISNNKLNSWRFKLYIKLLFLSPQIKLIGLSGSVAMLNADESHDIDLFIITAKNRLYTGRFIALILAQILGMRRRRHQINQNRSEVRKIRNQKNSDKSVKSDLSDVSDISDIRSLPTLRSLPNSSEIKDKICLNLFFDESNLSVPDNKKTEYVAHEVLQMKALVQKDDIYLRFIDANRWVFDIFPNAPRVIPRSEATRNLAKRNNVFYAPFGRWISHFVRNDRVSQWFEILLKSFQLHFIRKHQTTEIVTDSQLWFHPEDFARKIKI
ncbi:hypothetical protein HY612_01635, partial [Candidatus Roizmanbacteria bacterium]|nr:hypothetical protein [Candidatus Roizmanbacteria bacterium]